MKTLDGLGLLCIVDDPNMFKETLDMAVLAPEIKKLFEETLAAAWFTSPTIGRELATRLGIRRLPAVAVYCHRRASSLGGISKRTHCHFDLTYQTAQENIGHRSGS